MSENKPLTAGMGYVIGNYLIKGLAFLTLPVFARLMSTGDFGIYNIFVAYEGILVYIIGLALDNSFRSARYRYGFKEEKSANGKSYEEYVSTVVSIIFVNAAIWLILLSVFREPATKLLKLDFPSAILLIFYSLSNAVILCYNAHVSLRYDYKGFIVIGALNATGSIALSLILIIGPFSDRAYFGRMLGATVVITVLAFYIWIKFIKNQRPGQLKEYAGWGLKYSLPVVPHGISQIILASFDRIMIGHMVSEVAAGIYSFAYNIFAIVYVTYRSLDPVWSTWFFDKMNRQDYSSIKRYSSLYAVAMLVVSSIVILISPELVMIMGSAKYRDAVYCVIPIVAGGYFTFLYSIPCQVEYFREKTKQIGAATVCAAVINIVLNYVFIKQYGYIAAAYTTLFTYILYFLFHFFLAWKIEGKLLFSGKILFFCSVMVIGVAGAALVSVNYTVVRLLLAFVLFIALFMFLWKKHRGIIKQLIHRKG